MGSVEHWVYRRKDGAVVWHWENDGWYAARHGLDPKEEIITRENLDICGLKQHPREYEEARQLLGMPPKRQGDPPSGPTTAA